MARISITALHFGFRLDILLNHRTAARLLQRKQCMGAAQAAAPVSSEQI